MPRRSTTTEIRVNDITGCLMITASTLDVLVNTLGISDLGPVSNTIQSVLKLAQTIKQEKNECAEMMEKTNILLTAVIGAYISSDTGLDLAPTVLSQIAKFTETMYMIHSFLEAQQGGSKVKKLLRHGELGVLLKNCKVGLQQGIEFFKISGSGTVTDLKEMQRHAESRHKEIIDLIETMSSSDSASSISMVYSGVSSSSNSIAMLPSTPQIFHGRDSEFEEILKLFRQGTPRIAILGMGGMGKTSLAQAVLHHTEVTIKYTGNSFFVPCDKASNKIELAGHIGAHLGLKTSPDMTQEVLLHLSSNESPTLLVLDNLETVWEPVESRNAVEDFLSKLTDLPGLALMITMRGAERPAKVQWTRPFPLPLSPLNQDAARMLFIDIADDHHSVEEVDKILSLTNNMPLAITLLAHLVDAEDCTEILSRWEKEKTSLISDGYDKRSNLELSISLSLASPRITSMTGAQDLLSLLSMLPDGLSDAELKCSNFPIKNILGCKTALLRTALAYSDDHKRLKALVPIREYMATAFPPTEQMIRPLRKHFQELLELFTTESGKQSSALLVDRLTSNLTNIQNLLHNSLELGNPDLTGSIYSVCHMNILWRYIGRGAIPLLHQIHTFLKTSENHHLITFVITETIKTTQYHLVSEFEALIAQALEHVNHINDIELEALFHTSLARHYTIFKQDILKASKHYQNALSLAQSHDNYKAQSNALLGLSYNKYYTGKHTKAQEYAWEARKFAQLCGNSHMEAQALHIEAICAYALGDLTECISLVIRAEKAAALCGLSNGALHLGLMNLQAEVHVLKSEYVEAHGIHTQIHRVANDPFTSGLALSNLTDIALLTHGSAMEIQKMIDAAQIFAQKMGQPRGLTFCDMYQADLNLQEGNMSAMLFCDCLNRSWGRDSAIVSYCLERLGDISRWEGSGHDSSWSTIFLAHSLKVKESIGITKALLFLGDVFLAEGDEVSAISLFTVALEGFTNMDVHRSRAECMIRIGDISQKNDNPLKALELWETARPLFERSSQAKRVQDINTRLAKIGEDVREQYKRNLAQLAELVAPTGEVEEADASSDVEDTEVRAVEVLAI